MARLKDIYYTTQPLDGTPEVPGNAVPIDFYQGEDINLDIYLSFGDQVVKPDEWDIKGVVKKNQYAKLALWTAEIDNGVYARKPEGMYRFLIPSDITARFVPGTYWLTATMKSIKEHELKDVTLVVFNQPFSINASAASPFSRTQLDSTHTERTMPPPFDGKTL
ncbi:hypothetical protein [Acinetobacter sp.]|uniref:hypothetical protein n=1 Tax=Acinetobacter sp. TaxID=472 RepID=UPI003752D7BA